MNFRSLFSPIINRRHGGGRARFSYETVVSLSIRNRNRTTHFHSERAGRPHLPTALPRPAVPDPPGAATHPVPESPKCRRKPRRRRREHRKCRRSIEGSTENTAGSRFSCAAAAGGANFSPCKKKIKVAIPDFFVYVCTNVCARSAARFSDRSAQTLTQTQK